MSDRDSPAAYRFETPPRHEAVDEETLREAYGTIRGYFRYRAASYDGLRDSIDAAHIGVSVDAYLARSVRLAVAGGVGGMGLGLLVGIGVGTVASTVSLLSATLVGSVVGLCIGGSGVWVARRYYPRLAAAQRARRTDLLLPHATIFCYALVHGGLDLHDVLSRLAEESDVYGTVADEMAVVDDDIEWFNRGLLDALSAARDRSRSEDFQEFVDELVSVLEAGGDVGEFLSTQAQRHLELAQQSQEGLLEDLATAAEVYIAVAFAGPIFLLVVLIVASFSVPGLLAPMQALVYIVVPLLLFGIWTVVDFLMEPYRQHLGGQGTPLTTPADWLRAHVGVEPATLPVIGRFVTEPYETDGFRASAPATVSESDGAAPADGRAEAYRAERRPSLVERLRSDPFEALREYPSNSLFVSVPLGGFVALAVTLSGRVSLQIEPVVATTWLFVVPFLLVAAPFAYFHERNRRHDRRVRKRFPTALEILADADRNDLPIGDAFRLVSRRTGGVLEHEFDRIARDFALTHDVPGALERFAGRIDVPAVTRVVRLLDDSFSATDDLAPILQVVADDLSTRNSIRERQRRNMHPYVLLVVLGVLVYIGILLLFEVRFLPVVRDASIPAQGPLGGTPLQTGTVPIESYRQLFFHSALIQAIGNAFLLGKLRDNRVASGLKYAVVLTGVTLVAFLLFV